MQHKMKIFSGSSNPGLAQEICDYLGEPLCDAEISRFSDGEVMFRINENIRGRDVFVIQSTCPPVNDNLMELLIMVDALRRASAHRITTILPYYGYARQDRKAQPRVPITAKLVANLLTTAGVSRVLCTDLHAGQIQGYFDIPVDNLFAGPGPNRGGFDDQWSGRRRLEHTLAADVHTLYVRRDLQRIAAEDQQIRILAGRQAADLIVPAQRLGAQEPAQAGLA